MGIFSKGFRATRALAGMGAAAILSAALMVPQALADARNVATYGVDLTAEQHAQVENFFGAGAVGAQVIYVNNDQERAYLSSYIPLEQIGDKTYSCALVQPTTSGGIHVKTANLTYVTSDMIAATLATSGVSNCDVIAVCPFRVSGTGALTGVLMAYEQASGNELDAAKKDLANHELITTGTIAESVGPDIATLIVNNVKADVIKQGVTEVTEVDNIVNNVVQNIVNDNSTTNVDNSTTNVDNSTTNVTIVESAAGDSGAADSGAADSGATGSAAADSDAANSGADATKLQEDAAPAIQLSDEEMQALKDFAHALSEQGYDYEAMKGTLEMVSKNASQAAGVADPLAPKQDKDASNQKDVDKASSSASDKNASADPSSDLDGTVSGKPQDLDDTEQLSEDSILNQTDDLALGEAVLMDSTDLSTIEEGVETRQEAQAAEKSQAQDSQAQEGEGQEAPAQQSADDAADDPFAGLTWDETTTAPNAGDAGSVEGGVPAQSTEAPQPTETLQPAEAPQTTEGTQPDASQSTQSAPATPRAGEAIADALGLPTAVTGTGVALTLDRTVAATDLLDGTPQPLLVYENEGGAFGIMSADGTYLTEAVYAAQGIRGVGDGWILATSADGATDVYLQTVPPAEQAMPESTEQPVDIASAAARANLRLVASVESEVVQAKADGEHLNVQTSDGVISAVDANGAMSGVAPMSIEDFSYAAPAESVAEEAAVPAEMPASAEGEAAGAPDVAAAPESEDAANMLVAMPQVAAESVAATVPEALPGDARAVENTKGILWLVSDAMGKTQIFDAAGTNLLTASFDKVQVSADGNWLLVTNVEQKESALYRVQITPGA